MISDECKKRLFKGATNWIQTISWKTEEDLVELLEPREEIRAVQEKSQVDRGG